MLRNKMRKLFEGLRRRWQASGVNSGGCIVARGGFCLEGLEGRELMSGTVYVVDSLRDVVATDGEVTLREAVMAANENAAVTGDVLSGSGDGVDVITFAAGLSGGVILLDGVSLVVTDSVAIRGEVVIDGGGRSRVLEVRGGDVEVEVSGVELKGGYTFQDGGGIYNEGRLMLGDVVVRDHFAGGTYSQGGGIYNKGELRVVGSLIAGNRVWSLQGGGGLFNAGEVLIADSVIEHNVAMGDYGEGGGIYNQSGELAMMQVLMRGNEAMVNGGGIYNNYGELVMTNSNVIENIAEQGGGVFNISANLPRIQNSILTMNFASEYADIRGMYHDLHNVVGVDAGFVDAANGDYRLTFESVAVNRGDAGLLMRDEFDGDGDGNMDERWAVDYKGDVRVVGGYVDAGMFEYVLPGDVNYDDVVNIADLSRLASNFGKVTDVDGGILIGWREGDFNGDGRIDVQDLSQLAGRFGEAGPKGYPSVDNGALVLAVSESDEEGDGFEYEHVVGVLLGVG